MNELKIYNKNILQKFLQLKNKDCLSYPLLISSNQKFEKGEKILYIGKETNTWLYKYDKVTQNLLEQKYEELLNKLPNTTFWKFLSEINSDSKNVIWANTLICGDKYTKGTPKNYEDIKELSIEYLIFIYEYFKPDETVFVCGPNNPYYEIVNKFLNYYNINLECPNKDNLINYNEKNNIYWTYHPNFLRYQKNNKVITKIKNNL